MSRAYNMRIVVNAFNADKKADIKQAVEAEWDIDEWGVDDLSDIEGYGESSLCGGETEDEFSVRIMQAIWKANDAYCNVEVYATDLETSADGYYGDPEDYEAWINAKTK